MREAPSSRPRKEHAGVEAGEMFIERLSCPRGQGDRPQRSTRLSVGLRDAVDDCAPNGDDARTPIDVGPLERDPLARPKPRESSEDRKRLERVGELRRHGIELDKRERLHPRPLRLRVRHQRGRVLVQKLRPNGVVEHLAE